MIGTTRNGHVMTLEMQREDRRNALNCELVDSLRDAIEQAAADDVRAIVITGAGNVFSSGADLTDAAGLAEKLPYKAKALNIAIDLAPIRVRGPVAHAPGAVREGLEQSGRHRGPGRSHREASTQLSGRLMFWGAVRLVGGTAALVGGGLALRALQGAPAALGASPVEIDAVA